VPNFKIMPIIMSGGAGSRLWPASRAAYPKQLLALVSGRTMVQETALRVAGPEYTAPVFICNAAHAGAIDAQMAEIDSASFAIITEPMGRNTAPAAIVAAQFALRHGPDTLALLLPADHHVTKAAAFRKAVAGDYDWNAGIFLFSPAAFLAEIEKFEPEMLSAATAALDAASVNGHQHDLDPKIFASCPAQSIDYAVMEKTAKAAVVPCDIGWNDIGSFKALHEATKNENGNALSDGTILVKSDNCIVQSDGPMVSVVGLSNIGVIVKDGAVMVVNLDASQDVKAVVDELKASGRNALL